MSRVTLTCASHLGEDVVRLLVLGVEALGVERDDGARLHVVMLARVPVKRVEELELLAHLVAWETERSQRSVNGKGGASVVQVERVGVELYGRHGLVGDAGGPEEEPGR